MTCASAQPTASRPLAIQQAPGTPTRRPEGEEPWGGSESRLPTAVRAVGRVQSTRPEGEKPWGGFESTPATTTQQRAGG